MLDALSRSSEVDSENHRMGEVARRSGERRGKREASAAGGGDSSIKSQILL